MAATNVAQIENPGTSAVGDRKWPECLPLRAEPEAAFSDPYADVVIAIGPLIMMKFVSRMTAEAGIKTIVSMNSVMVDGTGMCGGCRLTVGDETKFACVDGPDFDGHLVDFDEAMMRGARYQEEENHSCKLGGYDNA